MDEGLKGRESYNKNRFPLAAIFDSDIILGEEVDWEGNPNRIGLRKTEVLTSACASRFHSQVSRTPLKVC